MIFEAGILSSPYPIRRSAASSAKKSHSLACSAGSLRRLKKCFAEYKRELNADPSMLSTRSGRASSKQSNLQMVAREFARFALVLAELSGKEISGRHLESAYALVNRRVEAMPCRSDRMVVAGLACAALACTGMRVHLVVDNDLALPLLKQVLFPVYTALGYTVMVVEAGADEASRARAYKQSITFVSARECAMDFLRDAVKWPQRSNLWMSKIDAMTGARARSRTTLMRGLPCAVLLDADSVLIDNARTPLALTQDAHPMHEVEELKQALEMVEHLERGRHYVLLDEGSEVALMPEGKQQLEAWAESLDGGWRVPHVADIMLAVAIVASQRVLVDTHYRIRQNRVEWLVEGRLVPGLEFYSRPFMERMVEIKEQCEVSSQRELAARASYQQIFNRYVHLCGACHSVQLIEKEFETVYGLSARNRWPLSRPKAFNAIHFLAQNEAKITRLKSWIRRQGEQHACLLLAFDNDTQQALNEELADLSPRLIQAGDTLSLDKDLLPGAVVLGLSVVLEHQLQMQREPLRQPLKIVFIGRSPRYSEDQRNRFWVQNSVFAEVEKTLFMSAEDELFTDSWTVGLESITRFGGSKLGGYILERRVRQIQARRAREYYDVRQGLISHDSTMHSMLSFSGRGLYE